MGDVIHSRIAKSNIYCSATLGCQDTRVIGPKSLIPSDLDLQGMRVFYSLEECLKGVDVFMHFVSKRREWKLDK